MATQTRTAQSAPKTPKKSTQSDPVHHIIDKLNRDYNLSVELPDVTLTPSSTRARAQQDAAFARSEEIVRQIRYHCFQTSLIDRILQNFHMEARAASQQWIRPSDDYESLSDPGASPKAESPGQVLGLQEILISILRKARPKQLESTTSTRSHTSPAAFPAVEVPKSKRRSEADNKAISPKKAKSSLSGGEKEAEGVINTLDNVPSRSRSPNPDFSSAARFSKRVQWSSRPSNASFSRDSVYANTSFSTSANTSRTSIFSAANDSFPGTQETTPTPVGPSSSDSQDLFPASSGHLDALNVSFSEHDPGASSNVATKPTEAEPAPLVKSRNAAVRSNISGFGHPTLREALSAPPKRSEPVDLLSRLEASWPRFPCWLNRAPFAVAWEVTRIAVHCNVDLGDVHMTYDESWTDQKQLRKSLFAHPLFAGKTFPEQACADAWKAAMSGFKTVRGQHVLFSATLVQAPKEKKGQVFTLSMMPISLDQGCRLHRRFGSDRFLELLVPASNSWIAPLNNPQASQEVTRWLSAKPHYFAGRHWRAFFSRDGGYKKPQKNLYLGPEPRPVFRERISLFAENGNNFHTVHIPPGGTSLKDDTPELRMKLSIYRMLDWLLQFDRNQEQPYLKLFSRIQLGLSKTTPIIVLGRDQIRIQDQDMCSPIGKVMNDGIGRMSRSLARKTRDVLGLSDIPSAIQGRIGPAKGMWLIDIADDKGDLWLELWPSQRKWNCDFGDPEHRTLEVRAHAKDPGSACLNIQFLPVLEDRAINKEAMREVIGKSLVDELNRQLEEQKDAMKYPLQFRQWISQTSSTRTQRLAHGHVPYMGGLPESNEEIMNSLIDAGFDPRRQRYLQELAWNLRYSLCESLKKKMSIKVSNSAYLFMVVDFWNVLEEGEVHLCFSSKFQTDTFSDSILHGCDVLVARSPAHFVSDIQRVKAVFKPELHTIKDVIVFSAKGNVPLADKLSGGDYDGDKAWVCWEPAIVSNFKNADVPPIPDLSSYLKKDTTAFADLGRGANSDAVLDMISRGIAFSMRPTYLGRATKFKERLCYRINSVNNDYALWLSALLGNLVDQAKQGFEFSEDDWYRFRDDRLGGRKFSRLEDPAYFLDSWSSGGKPTHIIDYLKFSVAKPTIDAELEKFHKAMTSSSGRRELRSFTMRKDKGEEETAELWDPDLAKPHEVFEKLAVKHPGLKRVLKNLTDDLKDVKEKWTTAVASTTDKDDLPRRIAEVYESWRAIQPRPDGVLDLTIEALLLQDYLCEELSQWALLRASMAFKKYYQHKPKFVWRMAGIQLMYIKSMKTAGHGSIPVAVTPSLYAALKPDNKYITQIVSKMRGEGSDYQGLHDDDEKNWQDSEGEE
ncbi:RNA-directed RNA polymerase [Colletotrichum graminicola]|uniref:RNA-dependent RNA polymerase n=1 Tax=Colletotrichum graminicola (strain M1.001 / M2 / FGSC 10212) TaxID=645133 RepID=E3QU45_COLGM|nr:RNA-directed RNA polymerase [Colletotrichum graminicola M1.001]EFQ34383.1 RNA-directed RNA polymerase [Colletotrichum graminicola M1.001]WDK22547.1 RNA-directed RNA polymerase [Colletotrichum graminicola]